jgi:hypothetical protein
MKPHIVVKAAMMAIATGLDPASADQIIISNVRH